MPIEPIDPDDLAHEMQREPVDEEESVSEPVDRPIEAPEADTLEQRAEIDDNDEE